LQNYSNIHCAVICIYPFPLGLAPTNRIIAYSKGMQENGAAVKIYVPFPTDDFSTANNKQVEGDFQGISYTYTSGRRKSKYKSFRALAVLSGFRKLKGYLTSSFKIYKDSKDRPYDCIFISTDAIPSLFIYSLLAKFINAKAIFIFDEYPIPIRHKLKSSIPFYKVFLFKRVLPILNAYISISEKLKNYYCNLSLKPAFILPTITDVSRFIVDNNHSAVKEDNKYLCYMGNMELTKDDVDNIIRAFAVIAEKHPGIKLYLYGPSDMKTSKVLENLIKDLALEGKVILKGQAESDKVPYILKNAHVLVSSQPDTIRASGGFPTKLGEYLAAGVPALLTDVGENSKYAEDGVHIFFCKPGDPSAYAAKLDYILENYDYALKTAANGKQYLFSNYSHVIMGRKLLEFVAAL
jgi:glycosyltransferase involved in cell wall biosynthesis